MIVNQSTDPGCRREDMINLGGFIARSTVNGPGIRAVCWVQGCPIHCDGCFNPQFWPFTRAEEISTEHLAEKILSVKGIDGVTFSGGEPFAQAKALAMLGRILRDAGFSVVTFSGFTWTELAAAPDKGWQDLLAVTDLLIAGPYISSCACTDPLKGSSNQQVIPLTKRLARPEHSRTRKCATIEFTISPEGTLAATGFPDHGLASLMHAIERGD